ncbi:MAG: transporter [Arachnia propionica]|nr:MAG: transporter [Arachnia propionica]
MLLEVSASVVISLFWMAASAVVATMVARATKHRLPEVVLLMTFGLVLGPYVLNWASPTGNEMVRELGLGLLFLLAGMEIELKDLGGRLGRWAAITWFAGFLLAVGIGFVIVPGALLTHAVALALAITSTALGTLLPILKNKGLLQTKLGTAVMAHGAVGELGPVLVMALLLTTHEPLTAGLAMGLVIIVTVVAMVLPIRMLAHIPGIAEQTDTAYMVTEQSLLRGVVLLLSALMALVAVFQFDVVLGAFAAGIVIKRLSRDHAESVLHSIEKLGYGFFIPVFFVSAGMSIPVHAVLRDPLTVFWFVLLIVIARGVPVFLSELFFDTGSGLARTGDRRQLALYSATGLPIIVAVTDIAVSSELMPKTLGASLVTAGAVTVFLFPLLADFVPKPKRSKATAPASNTNHSGAILVAKSDEQIARDKEAAERRQARETENRRKEQLRTAEREARDAEKAAIERVREFERKLHDACDIEDAEAAKLARAELRSAEADAFEAQRAAEAVSEELARLIAPPGPDPDRDPDPVDHSS